MYTRTWGLRICAAGLCLALAVPDQVTAAEADDVESLFKKGTEFRRKGRDAEALAEFQKAARIQDSPRAEAQMALAEQALGLWVDANLHLLKALGTPSDGWIQKNRSALDAAQSAIQSHLCQVEIWGAPAGAEAFVDGKRIGVLPSFSTWLEAGSIPVIVKALGYTDVIKTLRAPESGHIREHVELRKSVTAQSAQDPAANKTPALGIAEGSGGTDPQVINKKTEGADATAGDESPIYTRWWFWTAIGVGVAAAGGTAWILTHNKDNGPTCASPPCANW